MQMGPNLGMVDTDYVDKRVNRLCWWEAGVFLGSPGKFHGQQRFPAKANERWPLASTAATALETSSCGWTWAKPILLLQQDKQGADWLQALTLRFTYGERSNLHPAPTLCQMLHIHAFNLVRWANSSHLTLEEPEATGRSTCLTHRTQVSPGGWDLPLGWAAVAAPLGMFCVRKWPADTLFD